MSEAQNPIAPPPYTLYTVFNTRKGRDGGRVEPERRGEGQQGRTDHKGGLKIPT